MPVVVASAFRLIEAGHGAPQLLPALQCLVAGGGGPGDCIAGAGRVVVLAGLARRPGQKSEQPVDGVQFLGQIIFGDLKAQLTAGLFLQVMRFINDQPLVVLQHRAAHRQVSQQQGVVHHEDMSRFGAASGLAQEAGSAAPEGLADSLVVGAQPRPRPLVAETQVQIGAVAVLRIVEPHCRFAQHPRLVFRQVVGIAQAGPAPQANVVGTPLELGVPDGVGLQNAGFLQYLDHRRDVLVHQLFLQVDGVGGDDHPLPVAGGVQHGRQQVGYALADPGSALHDELAPLVYGPRDRFEHLGLLRPVLKTGECPGEYAMGLQQFLDLLLGEFPAHRAADRLAGPICQKSVGQAIGQAFQIQAVEPNGAGVARI